MSALSKNQKAALISIAREAWKKQGSPGSDALPPQKAFDAWRREQVFAACGVYGLTEASNDDFLAIKRHFLSLTDRAAEEFETALREDGEMRRRHLHNLKVALRDGEFSDAYGESIARDKFGHGTKACSDAELLQLVITVRARGGKKQRRRA